METQHVDYLLIAKWGCQRKFRGKHCSPSPTRHSHLLTKGCRTFHRYTSVTDPENNASIALCTVRKQNLIGYKLRGCSTLPPSFQKGRSGHHGLEIDSSTKHTRVPISELWAIRTTCCSSNSSFSVGEFSPYEKITKMFIIHMLLRRESHTLAEGWSLSTLRQTDYHGPIQIRRMGNFV